MNFDIIEFYPSINESLLLKALEFANFYKKNYRRWYQKKAVKSILYQGQIWIKTKLTTMKTQFMISQWVASMGPNYVSWSDYTY